MARLGDSSGRFVELDLLGYEFPDDALDDDYDANWLVVRLTVSDGERHDRQGGAGLSDTALGMTRRLAVWRILRPA